MEYCSKNVHHGDGVPAALQALIPAAAAAAAAAMSEAYQNGAGHGCSDCLVLRQVCYQTDGLAVIFGVHGDDAGTLKHAQFAVKHQGVAGQEPDDHVKFFFVNLSERVHGWAENFLQQVMERMHNDRSAHICETVSNISPPSFTNFVLPYFLPRAFQSNKLMSQRMASPILPSTPVVTAAHLQHAQEESLDMSKRFVDDYPQWINLLPETYSLILDRLDAFDTCTFPMVCKTWGDVYAQKRPLPHGRPTLLTSPSYHGWGFRETVEKYVFCIHNILSREMFLVQAEDLRYKTWIGGKDEWIVTKIDKRQSCALELFNPITGASTPLPSAIKTHDKKHISLWSLPHDARRVQLCRTPTEAGGYFAIAIYWNKQLAYTRVNSDHWVMLENPNEESIVNYADAILHGNKIIAISWSSNLWSWDLVEEGASPNLLLTATINTTKEWEAFDFIIAPSMYGNLLIISPFGKRRPSHVRRGMPRQEVYVDDVMLREVDIDAKTIEDTRNIGDWSLFLGVNYPFYVHVPVPSGDLKRNHIYLTDVPCHHNAVAINLSQKNPRGSVTFIDYPATSELDQMPLWYQPSSTRMLNSVGRVKSINSNYRIEYGTRNM